MAEKDKHDTILFVDSHSKKDPSPDHIFQIVASTNDQSAARLELKLVSFSSDGRVADGTCCDSFLSSTCTFLASKCDPKIEVCLG